MSWEDVGVELVTIPSGPVRSPDNSSDPDTDSDGGLWVYWNRLQPLLLGDPENMSFWGWEHLLCFTVSTVLLILIPAVGFMKDLTLRQTSPPSLPF